MILNKWDYEKHQYEPYDSPAKHIAFRTDDMDADTDCANCGTTVKVGDCYTSQQIHTESGFGFLVCQDCYDQEVQARLEAAKREKGK